MTEGNRLRKRLRQGDALALLAVAEIVRRRGELQRIKHDPLIARPKPL